MRPYDPIVSNMYIVLKSIENKQSWDYSPNLNLTKTIELTKLELSTL